MEESRIHRCMVRPCFLFLQQSPINFLSSTRPVRRTSKPSQESRSPMPSLFPCFYDTYDAARGLAMIACRQNPVPLSNRSLVSCQNTKCISTTVMLNDDVPTMGPAELQGNAENEGDRLPKPLCLRVPDGFRAIGPVLFLSLARPSLLYLVARRRFPLKLGGAWEKKEKKGDSN